jgi:hypothetical protein
LFPIETKSEQRPFTFPDGKWVAAQILPVTGSAFSA